MKLLKLRLISFIVMIIAAVVLVSVLIYADGLWAPFGRINDFTTFAYAFRNLMMQISTPVILLMLSLIGLTMDRNRS